MERPGRRLGRRPHCAPRGSGRGANALAVDAVMPTDFRSDSRSTARTVSWLTPNSAASDRRLLVTASARMVATCSAVSLRRRGVWDAERSE